jgi:tetratricopeptide (TPR) repeat protein
LYRRYRSTICGYSRDLPLAIDGEHDIKFHLPYSNRSVENLNVVAGCKLDSFFLVGSAKNQAISLYQTAINLKPDFIGAYCNLAKVWIKLGNLIEAAQVYYNVGKVKSQQNQNLEAISFYKKAIQLKSDQAEYYLALGDILKTQQQWDEAALAYDAAIKVDPKQAEAYFKQGIALSRLSQLYQAVSSYKKAIELNPNSYDYYHHLGDTFLCLKQYLNAIDAYEKSIELYPKYIWSYNNLGLTLSKIDISTLPNTKVVTSGSQKSSIIYLYNNRAHRVDILRTNKKEAPTALLYLTGSKDFNKKMRQHAKNGA